LCSLYAITVAAAVKWANAITLSVTGDATGSVSIDGSGDAAIALTLASVGAAGTYGGASTIPVLTVDSKGRVITASSVSVSSGLPSGAVAMWAASTAPAGYLECNGALLSRTTYASLFAAIGTTFGVGDGSTTFAIPDMRGYFPRGWDHNRGVDSGRAFGSSQSDAYGSHSHGINDPGHSHGTDLTLSGGFGGGYSWPGGGQAATSGTSAASTNISVQSAGSSETRPKNIVLMFIIKY